MNIYQERENRKSKKPDLVVEYHNWTMQKFVENLEKRNDFFFLGRMVIVDGLSCIGK